MKPQAAPDREHAAPTLPGHRRLMVIYLGGGLDCHQLLSPRRGANRQAYEAARAGLALPDHPRSALDADWQLHPQLPALHRQWARGRLGVVQNVGPLLRPTDAAQYRERSALLPVQLFSHSDQSELWQAGAPLAEVEGGTGWIGRLMDALDPGFNARAQLTPMLSASGPQRAFRARRLRQVGLGKDGAEPRFPGYRVAPSVVALAQSIMNRVPDGRAHFAHPIADEYARAQRRAQETVEVINEAIRGVPLSTPFPVLPELRTAARLFKADAALGRRRSASFFVHGGYDHHRNLNPTLDGRLQELDAGLAAFFDALAELRIEDEVLTLVYSEFGRCLVQNGSGTDHGWGGHALLIGGGLRGGLYGRAPDLGRKGPDLVDARGLLLPSTATEQLHAEIARWMGLPEARLPDVLPRVSRFPRLALDWA